MTGPLSGYRVVELTTTVSGPMAAMVLADQGADVIKIEPPLFGDTARYLGSIREGMGAMFAVLNRNKRSIALDLKAEEERAAFLSLVETADVLVENYRPGVMSGNGLGYETLSELNPGLVYASITGYGQDGPYQNRRVFDPLIQATAGTASEQGDERPTNMRAIVYDKVTAMTAAQAVTAALLQRAKTGRGQFLSVSMLDSALYYMWPDMMWSRTLLGDDIRHQGELADYFPIYRAKDGYVSIVLVSDESLELLSIWQGSELHLDERYATLAARLSRADAFNAEVEALIADITTAEICETLDAFGIPVARVNSLDDLHEDEQIRHAGSLVETDHPAIGRMRFPRPPVGFDVPSFPTRHAPYIGDDTREVLTELGISDEIISGLEARDAANAAALAAAMEAEHGA